MNLLIRGLELYVPTRLKRQKLKSLFEATASAFDAEVPDLSHLTFDQCLEKYALFSRDLIEKRLQAGGDVSEAGNALYVHAFALGDELRRQLHIENRGDVLSVGRALYRAIGIDFEGSTVGTVVIRSCFFSRFYSERVCRVISALDIGIAAGLSGGGELTFSQRITEGKPCCEAFFDFDGEES